MNHVFGEHVGRTVEAYVDDIVVKTRKASDLLSDLEVTFRCLKAKGVKLNPEKCVFGVPRGMLLGFIVSERGIEANPEKIAAIIRRKVQGKDVETIYLCGGTCCLTGMEEIIEKETGIRTIKPENPFLVTPAGIAMNCILPPTPGGEMRGDGAESPV